MRWHRRRQQPSRDDRQRVLRGAQAVRAAEQIVSVAWISRLEFTAEDDAEARRLLRRERVVHLHAANQRNRAAETDDRERAATGLTEAPAETPTGHTPAP